MKEIKKLSVYEIIKDEFAVSTEDGDKVFQEIEKAFKQDIKIKLSFDKIEISTSAFFNIAIGQLYGQFKSSKIKNTLSICDLSEDNENLLKWVVNTAKSYYRNPKKFEESINKIDND